MADYTSEIAALKAAIASGATTVRYADYTVTYDSLAQLFKRLAWLEKQQPGAAAKPSAIYAGFSRGDK